MVNAMLANGECENNGTLMFARNDIRVGMSIMSTVHAHAGRGQNMCGIVYFQPLKLIEN